LTEKQLREIWKKTNGHCHFCGDSISLRKRGYRRQRADGCWEVDHVIQKAKGGSITTENCLPACTSCNRLRWHRKGAALRELLLFGLIAKAEIEKLTETGKDLVRLRASRVSRTARRRNWPSVAQLKLRDPVLLEQIHQDNRKTLIRFLRKRLKQSFTAAELGRQTGVAKKWVRRLLETSLKVSITGQGGRYTFQSRPPKKRARSL
jgi:HNH endonuclease